MSSLSSAAASTASARSGIANGMTSTSAPTEVSQMSDQEAQEEFTRLQRHFSTYSREKLAALLSRAQQLQAINADERNHPELQATMQTLRSFQTYQKLTSRLGSQKPGPAANGSALSAKTAPQSQSQSQPASSSSNGSQSQTVVFGPEQLDALKHQIVAYKMLSRNMPLPEHIQASVLDPAKAKQALHAELPDVASLGTTGQVATAAIASHLGSQISNGKVVENQAASASSGKLAEVEQQRILPKFPGPQDDPSSPVYPYNAYSHPFTLLSDFFHSPDMLTATKQQRLLVPSLMPAGMDPQLLLAERDRYTKARIDQRIRELEELPSTLSEMPTIGSASALQGKENELEGDNSKIKAIIELKSLQLLDRQKALREQVVRSMNQATTLALDRTAFRRFKKATLRDARQTEQLERKQRVDREKRSRQKHMDYLMTICNHGKDLVAAHRTASQQALKIGRTVLKLHADTERDEARRVERVAKERLNALKADDEEAYLKLIDTAKDTRITHLIRQTDAYLEGLAQAVQAQQNDDVHADAIAAEKAGIKPPTADEIAAQTANQEVGVAVDETMFGAQRQDDPAEDKGKVDYYSVAHRITEHVSAQPSIMVGGKLKEYQIKGLQWMVSLYNNRLNGILADEMGLGKTIQTISLITFLIESKKQSGPFLIIVPLSTLTNWVNEFSKWAPSVSILVYKGTPGVRKQLAGRLRAGNFQCLLTTYEYVIKDKNLLGKLKWAHMIIDEGHRMKNTQSKLTVTLTTNYTSRYRLLLTGTPLQNNLPELWALLNFVLPKIFNSVKSFDEWFNTPFANAGGDSGMQLTEEETLLIIKRLHKVLRPFLLRRLKKDVESELPDKVEKVIKCQMSSLQAKLYSGMKKHKMIMTGDDSAMVGKKKNMGIRGLQNAIMQLRKICNHPYVFEQVEAAINPLKGTGPDIYRVSGKFELLDRLLPKLFKTGHRVLIFFQMTAIMDIMEDFLRFRHFKYLRLDGSTKPDDRSVLLHEFNKPNSEYFIFILSTRAGGLGLNLQTADTVIIYDSDWNPHQDLQAQDRAHRIGQKMEVRILRLVTEKSVEEHILETANYKLQIDAKVIQAGKYDNQATADERETLLRALLEQNDDDDEERGGEITDEELNQILARGEHEIKRFEEIDEERERNENQMWKASGGKGPKPPRLIQETELPEMYQQDFDAVDAFREEAEEEAAHRKRQVVHYDDGLTEDQFLKALEDDDVDMADLVEKKRERDAKRRAKGVQNEDGSQAGTPEPRSKGKKSRGGQDDDTPEGSPGPGNRKRKRRSESVAQTPDYEPEGSNSQSSKVNSKKRKQPGPEDDSRERVKDALLSCYTAVENTLEPETGRKRCLLFLDVPKKTDYPDYHVLIAKPVAMRQIKRRLTNRTYRTVSACRDDFHQMFANAKLYNQEGSWVWVDAVELQKVFDEAYQNFCANTDLPGSSDPPTLFQTSLGPPPAQQQPAQSQEGAPNGTGNGVDQMMGSG